MTDLLQATFTAANAVNHTSKPYTIYEISITSPVAPSWVLLKRYRSFEAFNKNLKRELVHHPELRHIEYELPPLPPRTLWGRLAAETVAKRQKIFQEYVRFLLSHPQLVCNTLVMDFLNVPASIREIIDNKEKLFTNKKHTIPEPNVPYPSSLSTAEDQVNLLLSELSNDRNRNSVTALLHFERWYFEYSPNMNASLIHRLLLGVPTTKQGHPALHGLLPACKFTSNPSKLAWLAAMALLLKLMDIERNKYARLIQQVFFHLDAKMYAQMDIHRHIKDSTSNNAFFIMELIYKNLPNLHPKLYCSDMEARMQFKKWMKFKNEAYTVGHVIKNMETQEMEHLNHSFNWQQKSFKQMSDEIFKQYRFFANDSDDEYQFLPKMMDKYGHHLTVRHKKDIYTDRWKIKISFSVNHPPRDVFKSLMFGHGWDKKLISSEIIEKLDSNHIITHDTYKCSNNAYKFRDFVFLKCFREMNKSERYFILISSIINYEKMPVVTDKLRSILFPSGFEIRRSGSNPKRSHISCRLHFTPESVDIVSADLLAESEDLFQSMIRIVKLTDIMKQKKQWLQQPANVKRTINKTVNNSQDHNYNNANSNHL